MQEALFDETVADISGSLVVAMSVLRRVGIAGACNE